MKQMLLLMGLVVGLLVSRYMDQDIKRSSELVIKYNIEIDSYYNQCGLSQDIPILTGNIYVCPNNISEKVSSETPFQHEIIFSINQKEVKAIDII